MSSEAKLYSEVGVGVGGGAVDDVARRIRSKEDALVDAAVQSLATMRADLAENAVEVFRQYQVRDPMLYVDGDTDRISPLLTRLKDVEDFADLPVTHVARRAAKRYNVYSTNRGISGMAAAVMFKTFAKNNRLPYAIGTFRAAATDPAGVTAWLRSGSAYAFLNQVLSLLDMDADAALAGAGAGAP
jgi:hypothetical protein